MVTYIYGLHDPRTMELRYIGKTASPLLRMKGHIDDSRKLNLGPCHRRRWIAALLRKGLRPEWSLLDICEGDGCAEEVRHIAEARRRGARLVNSTDGGDGATGMCHTPESRKLMSASRKGVPKSPEWRQKISDAHRGVPKTRAAVEKLAAKLRGRKLSPDHVEKVASQLRGRKRDPDVIERGAAKRRGRKLPAWQVERLRSIHLGKPLSEEHRRKLSEAGKGKKHSLTPETASRKELARQSTRYGNPDLRRTLTAQLIEDRHAIGTGRKVWARFAGIDFQTINEIEWGRMLPGLAQIARLRSALVAIQEAVASGQLRLRRTNVLVSRPASPLCTPSDRSAGSSRPPDRP